MRNPPSREPQLSLSHTHTQLDLGVGGTARSVFRGTHLTRSPGRSWSDRTELARPSGRRPGRRSCRRSISHCRPSCRCSRSSLLRVEVVDAAVSDSSGSPFVEPSLRYQVRIS
eukprot:8095923-Heterocapsa_arctica.AAC.1